MALLAPMSARLPQKRELADAASKGESLTTNEAALFTGYSKDHIGLMMRKRILKGSKKGRDWFVDARSLNDYVKSNPHPGPKTY